MKRIKVQAPPANALTLEQLRYFLAAARVGNFTQAAEASFLSQSAFSRQIQALEKALGSPLFDRLGRRVRLNDAGRELERRAAEIISRVDRLPGEVAPAGQGLRGTIRLGANMTVGIRLLPSWLAAFGQRHPGVHVTLLLRLTSEMPPLLRGETIDASIQEHPEPEQLEGRPPLKVHLSYRDELWIVGPRGVEAGSRPRPEARWFGIMDPARRRRLARLGFAIGDATRVPGADVALKFAEAGMGYAVVPGFLARASWKAGRVTRLAWSLDRRIAFVTLAGRPLSPCVRRLKEFLQPRWEAEAKRQRGEAR